MSNITRREGENDVGECWKKVRGLCMSVTWLVFMRGDEKGKNSRN